jgi:sugar/nucleoside kinase (ribokinase family)
MVGPFDVLAVGDVVWRFATDAVPARADALSFGGAPFAALALARRGLRVALVTTLPFGFEGRLLHRELTAAGVDTTGVALTDVAPRLVVLDRTGEAHDRSDVDATGRALEVPEGFGARVFLASGLSPLVSRAAALCKAARAARRRGSIVVVEVQARWQLWMGQDPRAVRSILREADVVRITTGDLATLGLDVDAIRAEMRPSAVLVGSQSVDEAWVSGPFGTLAPKSHEPRSSAPIEPDVLAAVICDELARAGTPSEDRPELWERALARARAAARAVG